MTWGLFDDRDVEFAYKFCLSHLGDRGYCAKVVELLRDVEIMRVFTWGGKPRFQLVLPQVEHTVAVAFDRDRNYIFIFLRHATYVAILVYKRDGDGFVLSHAGVDALEVKALINGPPNFAPFKGRNV